MTLLRTAPQSHRAACGPCAPPQVQTKLQGFFSTLKAKAEEKMAERRGATE